MRFKCLISFFILCSACLLAETGFVEPWGKDEGIKVIPIQPPPEKKQKPSPLAKVAEALILFHQNVITHIDAGRSHFRPSSSGYMLGAIRKHGFIKGFVMGCDRLLRENDDPWVYRSVLDENKLFKWDPPP